MSSRVAKAATVGEFGLDNVLVSHRVEAEVAAPDGNLGVRGFGDDADADCRDTPPWVVGRKESPVVEEIAGNGVAHVVARERKALDPKPDLFCVQGCRVTGHGSSGADILTVNLKGHTDGR